MTFGLDSIPATDPNLAWHRCKTPAGWSMKGWICGPMIKCVVHWVDDFTKPCLKVMSGGKLKCWRCEQGMDARIQGWVPVYTERNPKCVVITPKTTAFGMQEWPRGTPVEFSRGSGETSPVRAKKLPLDMVNKGITKRVAKQTPHVIIPWMLNIWKDSTLQQYFTEASIPVPHDPNELPVNKELVAQLLGEPVT